MKPPDPLRKIIHVDMDAFYASIEQRDDSTLRNRPIVVGGSPHSRGVVATCSYEARKYGIHSAMPCAHAYRLCPQAVFVRPRFDVYKQVSAQIREVFHEYTDLVEPLSLDEAYLDVTENNKGEVSATRIARSIKEDINRRTWLTASAGVSFNKFLAKVASDIDKPDGLTVITPEDADGFIEALPIGKFFGVGKVTAAKMEANGIYNGGDLKLRSIAELELLFGRNGSYFYNIVRGRDNRAVNPHRVRKSVGKERTFRDDIDDMHEIFDILEQLTAQVSAYCQTHGIYGRTVTLKVKYHDFHQITRSISFSKPINSAEDMMSAVCRSLDKTDVGTVKVRLLGVTLSNLTRDEQEDALESQLVFDFMKEQGTQICVPYKDNVLTKPPEIL